MGITDVLSLLGGLALFLYGMQMMSTGLEAAAGNKMKSILEKLTSNRFKGVLVGAAITAVIQSSSATTVMVVGFVNSGLMTLNQAVWVIMGANIGTTITGQLIALDIGAIAPVFAIAGVAAMMFVKSEKVHHISSIFAGLGVLFMGMDMMVAAMEPLQESEAFINLMTQFSNPLLGILVGAVFTAVIQSSSASVGILQTLALNGVVNWQSAIFITLGQNIGTCVTALLSSVGAHRTAKRAAVIHLLFNCIGAVIFGILMFILFQFRPQLAASPINSVEISIFHTIFNIANTIILFPFTNYLVKLSYVFVKEPKEEKEQVVDVESEMMRHLDSRILENPSFAIEHVENEVVRMGQTALMNLKISGEAILKNNQFEAEEVLKNEETINHMERMLTDYLVKVSNLSLNEEQHLLVKNLLYTISDIERIGDHCKNLAELAEAKIKNNIQFSAEAQREMEEIIMAAVDSVNHAVKAREAHDMYEVRQVVQCEEQVDSLEEDLRERHVERLSKNLCTTETGVIFLDAISNLERVSDHAHNIAGYVRDEM